jgi:hypothetical protein
MERVMDPEVQAMGEIAKALEPLEPEAKKRVLKWAAERFQAGLAIGVQDSPRGRDAGGHGPLPERTFADLAELFDSANPQTGLDKVLVTAYWYQTVKSQEVWDSQTINNDLKHLGHQSSNITRDLDALIKRTPRLVIQVRKEGTAKQARKLFKLTREGLKAVEAMLNASATPESGG